MEIIPIPGFSEPFSCWSHLLAAGAAAIGFFFLLKKGRGNSVRVTSLSVYSFALVFLFSMSGVYHLLDHAGVPRAVLQRLDHAAIWVLIAGTFTPLHTILFRGLWRWGVLSLIWAIAITGLVLEMVFFESIPEWMVLTFFLGLGWIGVLSGGHFKRTYADKSLKYLTMGGVSYSIGAVLDFVRWPVIIPGVIGPHELFHLFVILGSVLHWIFIYHWADYPVANKLVFKVRVYPEGRYIARAQSERQLQIEAETIDTLKEKISATLREKYHVNMEPPQVLLKYFHEEHL